MVHHITTHQAQAQAESSAESSGLNKIEAQYKPLTLTASIEAQARHSFLWLYITRTTLGYMKNIPFCCARYF